MVDKKKKKTGLQKDVSSIFKGVTIPSKNGNYLRQSDELILTKRSHIKHNKPPVSKDTRNTPNRKTELNHKINKSSDVFLSEPSVQKTDETFVPKDTGYAPDNQTVLKNIIDKLEEISLPESSIKKPDETIAQKDIGHVPDNQTAVEKIIDESEKVSLPEPSAQKIDKPVESKDTGYVLDSRNTMKNTIDEPEEPLLTKSSIKKPDELPVQKQPDNVPERQSILKHLIYEQDKQPVPKKPDDIPPKPMPSNIQKPRMSPAKKPDLPSSLNNESPAKQFVAEVTREIITSKSTWQQIKDRIFSPNSGGRTAKEKATMALIPVLALVFIFVFRQVFWASPNKMAEATQIKTKSDATVTTHTEQNIDWKIPEPYPAMIHDPMKLTAISAGQAKVQTQKSETENITAIIVKGILYSSDNPAALVDNRIVRVGDTVQDATVVRINRDGVEFEMNGKRWKENVQR